MNKQGASPSSYIGQISRCKSEAKGETFAGHEGLSDRQAREGWKDCDGRGAGQQLDEEGGKYATS